jgi:hypothetical protein
MKVHEEINESLAWIETNQYVSHEEYKNLFFYSII